MAREPRRQRGVWVGEHSCRFGKVSGHGPGYEVVSVSEEMVDPRCPECGEPVGTTATYCMHCSADLTGRGPVDGADGEPPTDTEDVSGDPGTVGDTNGPDTGDGSLLDPDGLADNSLTVAVGVVGGFVVGLVGTLVLAFLTGGFLGLLGLPLWVVATAYLVTRRTVQEAVSKAAYGVAAVLVLVPLLPLSPFVDAGTGGDRAFGFVFLVFLVGTPAAIAAGVGYLASRFVPEEPAA